MKKVRIYGTLGPACGDRATLEQMLREGMDGVRLNLSHMTLEEAADQIGAYRDAARACGKEPELLIDMQGPELRIGALPSPVRLGDGERIKADAIPFPDSVKEALTAGQEILLDDGKLLLQAEADGRALVKRGGSLTSRKSIALPGTEIRLPPLTEADLRNIACAADHGVTGVMQPFVRSAEDLKAVRAALDAAGGQKIRLFAKIEDLNGVNCLPDLIDAADEIVIARGDLGNAVPLWELPELDDEFASEVSEFETLKEYRESVKKELTERKQKTLDNERRDTILKKAVENAKMEIPKEMVDMQCEQMVNDYSQRLQMQGLSLDMYMKFSGQTKEQLKDSFKERAEEQIKSSLVLEAIAKTENVEVSEEDLEAEYERMANAYQMEVEKIRELISDVEKENMKENLAMEKALDLIAK